MRAYDIQGARLEHAKYTNNSQLLYLQKTFICRFEQPISPLNHVIKLRSKSRWHLTLNTHPLIRSHGAPRRTTQIRTSTYRMMSAIRTRLFQLLEWVRLPLLRSSVNTNLVARMSVAWWGFSAITIVGSISKWAVWI